MRLKPRRWMIKQTISFLHLPLWLIKICLSVSSTLVFYPLECPVKCKQFFNPRFVTSCLSPFIICIMLLNSSRRWAFFLNLFIYSHQFYLLDLATSLVSSFFHLMTTDQRGPGRRSQICISSGSLWGATQMQHQEMWCKFPQGRHKVMVVTTSLGFFFFLHKYVCWRDKCSPLSNRTGWQSWHGSLALYLTTS